MNINIEAIRKLRGLQIKQQRIAKGLTQEQLAELTNVTRQTIIRIEAGDGGYMVDNEILLSETLKKYNV